MDTLYPGFRYIETGDTLDPADREDREAGEEALWRRSSVPLLPGWAADHRSDQISFVYWNISLETSLFTENQLWVSIRCFLWTTGNKELFEV